MSRSVRCAHIATSAVLPLVAAAVRAQGFDKVNTTVVNINTILVTISVAVVTIAIIWAGFKIIFPAPPLPPPPPLLAGGPLVGGAGAFAAYIVN
ncbi:TrbC/VirB2 family protein [Aquincola sp. J276]|uniref:TrbC/VirB2 family protein n=1 Tax=Aquincola sp. J276 TaxID=2898432 RepID=UPI002150C99B|nr:TrbC/VirB2 family protein [Aquincola sp. J276]MCR5868128.1 TrbC/VirB2 family protein [Aquincola sp. J276]